MRDVRVGDKIKSLAGCARLPEGTIVGFAHPVYQGPQSAVRSAKADGSLWWSWSGHPGLWSTREIKQATGWAPFHVLALTDQPVLNTEVRIGYRVFGEPESVSETEPSAPGALRYDA